ncbi:MAG: DUF5706 domain-containing protein [Flavobacteriaceae bacterium]|nr:DUF5706 domain-containing protein [Flavobacteriaceae bacterium]
MEIIAKASIYVSDLLSVKLSNNILYHNLNHTQRVVKSAEEIAAGMSLEAKSLKVLRLAAWFHDTGYVDGYENHEEKSCEIAKEFLQQEAVAEEEILAVCDLIMATVWEYEPKNELEKILRDADCSHFAREDFGEITRQLRKEFELVKGDKIGAKKWRKINIEVLENKHCYYTKYALQHWQPKKAALLAKLKKAAKRDKEILSKERTKMRLKEESPERTVQTMYRVALRNHINLSSIADTKANILLSVNAIIVSVALSNLIPKLDNPSNYYLVVPTSIFLIFSVASIVMSVLATRPNVTDVMFTQQDLAAKKVNLLFFGNFHKMRLEDYEDAMLDMVKDKEHLHRALTKDLYYLGKVLHRKYKLLRNTYTIFVIGIIITVISFGIAFHFYGTGRILE